MATTASGWIPTPNHVWHTGVDSNRVVEPDPAGNAQLLPARQPVRPGRRGGQQPQRVGRALDARTDQTPDNLTGTPPASGDNATSTASVDFTRITATLVTIEIGLIASSATAHCVTGPGGGLVPAFSGASTIASLKINGVSITVGSAPLTIRLVIGSLRLNSTTTTATATSVTQQAVVLDTPAGYLLHAGPDQIDLHAFAEDLATARAARDRGDLDGCARWFTAALSRWRGPTLEGVPGPHAEAVRVQLEERLQAGLAELIEVDIARGRHADWVAELVRLVSAA